MATRRIQDLIEKFPHKVPIFVEDPDKLIRKSKYLVPREQSLAEFMNYLRNNATLNPTETIFIFIGGRLPLLSTTLGELYEKNKEEDLMLHLDIRKESSFGYAYPL